jgi:hypothetical protein
MLFCQIGLVSRNRKFFAIFSIPKSAAGFKPWILELRVKCSTTEPPLSKKYNPQNVIKSDYNKVTLAEKI